jgi:EAL domain-containing protein (putative c-di-GMP-specific phosphodiesterase class I)
MGLVPPADFVPVAESSPLIFEIGNWVLEETCAQVRRWLDRLAPRAVPPVAVNVTARQLFHPEFLTRVREILEHHALSGSQVRFDVSETDLMKDASAAAAILDRLHGMGIRVAMDDFGTGYSSLSLLHSLPISALKIDRSFISRPRERLRKWGVARTIVELAKILDLEVIAEGIETREQFLELRSAGCHQAQGFHFAGPVGPPQAEEFIRDGYPLDLEAPVR